MNGEALYERYKDALKRGHVASLRGRLDEALEAYAEAAQIAPERSTPYTSSGTALMRRKRPSDALRQYEAALRIGPRDEAALLGRAQALEALGQRADAADAFAALAEVHASGGRLADAVDSARRGLELAEGRHRRRTLEGLIARLRASEPGEPGRLALERALRVLEGPALPPAVSPSLVAAPVERAADVAADQADVVAEPAAAGPEAVAEPEPEADAAEAAPEAEVGIAVDATPETEPNVESGEPGPAADAAPEPEPAFPAALDREVPPGASLDSLLRAAELGLDSGDPSARDRFLDLAAASLREGLVSAALDACYQALSLDPDDHDLHLALVQLYDHEGWRAIATEKLDLVARLAALDGDNVAAERIAATRAARAS